MANTSHTGVTFNYTPEDYAAAAQFQFLSGRPGPLFASVVLVVCCVALFSIVHAKGAPIWIALMVPATVMSALAAIVVALWKFVIPWLGRRSFAKHPLAHLTRSLSLRSDGLHFETERGATVVLWRDIIKWRNDHRTILIFLAPQLKILIPMRWVDGGFPIAELRAALTREVGPLRRWA